MFCNKLYIIAKPQAKEAYIFPTSYFILPMTLSSPKRGQEGSYSLDSIEQTVLLVARSYFLDLHMELLTSGIERNLTYKSVIAWTLEIRNLIALFAEFIQFLCQSMLCLFCCKHSCSSFSCSYPILIFSL